MFVPADLLNALIEDLIARGKASGPARPWLGLNTEELRGRLFVARVSPDGPADRAGIVAGDILIGIGADEVVVAGRLLPQALVARRGRYRGGPARAARRRGERGDAALDRPAGILQGAAELLTRCRVSADHQFLRVGLARLASASTAAGGAGCPWSARRSPPARSARSSAFPPGRGSAPRSAARRTRRRARAAGRAAWPRSCRSPASCAPGRRRS